MAIRSGFRPIGLENPAHRTICSALPSVFRLCFPWTVGMFFLTAAGSWSAVQAQSSQAKIVGLGATTCQRFSIDIRSNPILRRDYLAWAQGFMSGILSSRPSGVDEQLDLNPVTFDLVNQLHFLEDHCAQNSAINFSDAVAALYKRLRKEGKT